MFKVQLHLIKHEVALCVTMDYTEKAFNHRIIKQPVILSTCHGILSNHGTCTSFLNNFIESRAIPRHTVKYVENL